MNALRKSVSLKKDMKIVRNAANTPCAEKTLTSLIRRISNLGLSANDITRAVMPYYSNFWLDKQK